MFCNEPPKPDDPLLNTFNLIVPTPPHRPAKPSLRWANMCVDGCLAVIRGESGPSCRQKVYDHPKWADK